MEKTCTKCKEKKSVAFFSKDRSARDGLCRWCKSCRSKHNSTLCKTSRRVGVRVPRKRVREKLVRVAPLTAEQKMLLAQERRIRNRFKASLTQSRSKAKRYGYVPCDATAEELVAAFAGKCHICGVPEAECNQKLHMDHCHETGKFRGWLCYHCNNLLGRAKDSEEILINALHYLMNQEEHSIE